MTRLLTIAVAWAAVASTLGAQPPADAPLKDSLNADDLRKIGERVRGFGATLDPKLLEAIDKLVKENPGLQLDQLARKLLDAQPELVQPGNMAKLQAALQNLAEKTVAKPSVAPPVPPTLKTPEATLLPVPMPPLNPMAQPVPPNDPPPPNAGDPPVPKPTDPPAVTDPPPVVTPPPAVTPPTTEQEAQFRAATGWWEKNVGPMSDSPALKELLAEFIKGAGASDGQSPLASLFKGLKGEGGAEFKDFLKGVLPSGFKLPDLGLTRPNSLPSLPTAPTVPRGRPDLDFGGFDDLGLPAAVGAAAVLAAFGYFAVLPWLRGRAAGLTPTPVPGLGPWPLDPRSVTDRDTLVRAFDYLSVLTLGPAARQYSHLTVAGELRRRVPAADDIADELGHYYEVARYTPPGEPVAAADLAAARAALCWLAGVPA